METKLFRVVSWVLLLFTVPPFVVGDNVNISRPAQVHIGAIYTFDSTIGKVAKIAMQEAVNDVNANRSVLPGTKLVLTMQNSNCSGFVGMVQGNLLINLFSLHLLLIPICICVNISLYKLQLCGSWRLMSSQ